MRIVITGASGNVGSALLRRLVDRGEHDLVGLVRRPPEPAVYPFDAAEWVPVDLADDVYEEALRTALHRADAIVHLAWGFQPGHRVDYLERLGVGGTSRVLRAAAEAGVRHVVHMSSVGAYSPRADEQPVDETWPTDGFPSSPYSRHKVAAERLLDDFEREHPGIVVSRIRPGFIGQRSAGSALLRYTVPSVVPAAALRRMPALPLDRSLRVPFVHAEDVAEAFVRVLEAGLPGPLNLAARPDVTAGDVAAAFGAHLVHVPVKVLRSAVAASWRTGLQSVDPGWVDLAYGVPLLDTTRAERELAWVPAIDGVTAVWEAVAGIRNAEHDETPALRLRTVQDGLTSLVRHGPVGIRREP